VRLTEFTILKNPKKQDPFHMAQKKDQDSSTDDGVTVDQQGASGVAYRVVSQFISDMSFENPHGVKSLLPDPENAPEVRLSVNLKHRHAGHGQYEVLLLVTAQTVRGEDTLFIAELVYGAAIKLVTEVEQEELNHILLCEIPRYLYPFAREIIADVTRRGGFPPLFLAPIDFDHMFENRKDQMPPIGEEEKETAEA